MKITRLVLYENRAPFAFRFRSPHKKWTGARSIILALGFDNGIWGWGESAPRPYVTGEDCVSVLSVLQEQLAASLIGMVITPDHTKADLRSMLGALAAGMMLREKPINSAMGAVDLALLDALGRLRNESVAAMLGEPQRSGLMYSTTVPIISMDAVKKQFAVVFDYPFRHFKIALSGNPVADMERVHTIRSLAGNGVRIGLEGNGKLTSAQLEMLLAEMPVADFSFFEQPLSPSAVGDLQAIRPKIPVPVVADESTCSLPDAEAVAATGVFDRINVKISKCGGLLKSLEIAEFAVARGLTCHLGSHVGESRILQAAGICFALAAPGLVLMETGSSLLFGDAPLFLPGEAEHKHQTNTEGPGIGPGLGLNITEKAADRLFGAPVAVIGRS